MTQQSPLNPFDPAQPAITSFVGRTELLETLVDILRAGKSYALTGPPGIGKTNLLLKVQGGIRNDSEGGNMSPIPIALHLECSRQEERAGALFVRITTKLIDCLAEQLGHFCPLSVQKEALAAAESESLKKALDVPTAWALKEFGQSLRATLMLDALHRITSKRTLEVLLAQLNNSADRQNVNVLLAGRRPLVDCVPNSVSDIKMLLTGQRELGPMSDTETELLVAIANQSGWPVAEGAASLAFEFTKGHPYRLQYYLHESLEQYREITPKSLLGLRQKADEYLDKVLAETVEAPEDVAGDVSDGKQVRVIKSLLSGMDSITINDYVVVGNYTRFDEKIRSTLRNHARSIREACHRSDGGYPNFLIWGSSGDGKTYFATEIANDAKIQWDKINLARDADVADEKTYRRRLAEVKAKDRPFLFIIDECDKRTDPWVCRVLFDHLSFESTENASKATGAGDRSRKRTDASQKKSAPSGNKVFVLIGSTGDSVESFWTGMRKLPGGRDLETRIPPPPIVVPGTTIGDRLLVVLSQIRRYAREKSRRIDLVEKLALAYVLLCDKGSTPRGIEEMVMRAVGRLGNGDGELRYSHFFDYHEDTEAAFVMKHGELYDALQSRSLRLK